MYHNSLSVCFPYNYTVHVGSGIFPCFSQFVFLLPNCLVCLLFAIKCPTKIVFIIFCINIWYIHISLCYKFPFVFFTPYSYLRAPHCGCAENFAGSHPQFSFCPFFILVLSFPNTNKSLISLFYTNLFLCSFSFYPFYFASSKYSYTFFGSPI